MSANGAIFCCDVFGRTTNSGAFNSVTAGSLTSCKGCINELEVTNLTVNNEIIFQNGGCPFLTANLPLQNIPFGGPCSVELLPGDCWGQYFAWDTANNRWSIASQIAGVVAGPLGVSNVYLGCNAMNPGVTGLNNTTIGNLAGFNITSGSNNSAVGQNALANQTTGSGHVAVGQNALATDKIGSLNNIAIGENAMATSIANPNAAGVVSRNVAIGTSALLNGGNQDIAIGNGVLQNDLSTFPGANPGQNIAIGTTVLNTIGVGSNGSHIGIGNNVMNSISFSLGSNVAIGNSIMTVNPVTTAAFCVAIGNGPLARNISGSSNVAIGPGAMASNTSGDVCVAIGTNALGTTVATSSGNVAVGNFAGFGDVSALSIAIGASALASPNIPQNIAIGNRAMGLSAGITGIGRDIAIGEFSQAEVTTGFGNLSVGFDCLRRNNTGSRNIVMGDNALSAVATAGGAGPSQNVIIGTSAAFVAGPINRNVLIGNGVASATLLSGSDNVIVGNSAGVDLAGPARSGTIILGSGATSLAGFTGPSGADNQLVIGDAANFQANSVRGIAGGVAGPATLTVANLGASGPTVAAQNSWLSLTIGATQYWIPLWV